MRKEIGTHSNEPHTENTGANAQLIAGCSSKPSWLVITEFFERSAESVPRAVASEAPGAGRRWEARSLPLAVLIRQASHVRRNRSRFFTGGAIARNFSRLPLKGRPPANRFPQASCPCAVRPGRVRPCRAFERILPILGCPGGRRPASTSAADRLSIARPRTL